MMPWEHAMLGYIGLSVIVRVGRYDPPTATETAMVVFASVLPDLVDKPLAWQFNMFASGHAVGHSLFVAVPLSAAVLVVAYRRRTVRTGIAFGMGYLLHLPADVFPQYLHGEGLPLHRVLWPVRHEGSGYESGFRGELRENLVEYVGWFDEQLTSGTPDPYLFVLVGITAFGLLLWVVDGMPIGRQVYDAVRGAGRRTDDP